MDQSRRDFIRRSAVVGGVVWAAPAMSTISTASAGAVSPCICTGTFRGIRAESGALGITTAVDSGLNNCPASVNEGSIVRVEVVSCSLTGCTETGVLGAFCIGSIEGSAVTVIAAGPSSLGECPDYTGTVNVVDLTIPGLFSNFTGSLDPNIEVNVGNDISLVVNEQFCDPVTGEFVVRALRAVVSVGGMLSAEVILGEARVTSTCCPCS